MNSKAAAIRAELERRGVTIPPLQKEEKPGNDIVSRREAILAELQRRGVNPQEDSPSGQENFSYWDRAKQFGGGAVSGLIHTGMKQALVDPSLILSQQSQEHAENLYNNFKQQEAQDLQSMDAMGRVLHHAGGFGANMLTTPIAAARVASLPKIASALGKDALMGTGIGGVSGIAQELGVNPLVADIGASVLTPLAVGGIKKVATGVGKTAAYPISPAIRRRVAEKEGTREASKILQDVAKGVENPEKAINLPKALKDLGPRVEAEVAGEATRRGVLENLEKYKKTRTEVTAPLYEKIENIEEGLSPLHTKPLLEKELKTAKGSMRSSLEKIQEMLEPNEKFSPEDLRNLKVLEEYKNVSPEAFKTIQSQFPVKGRMNPTPLEIENTIKEVADMMEKAYRKGANKLGKKLETVKEGLEKDFRSLPEGLTHREKYAELSSPINDIQEHRTLGKIVEKGPYGKGYKIGSGEIPKEFVNTSMKSIEDSRDLLKEVGKNKEVMGKLQGYINNEIYNDLVDKTGRITSIKKLENWVKDHPGAAILYPHLETKLKNISNAQYLVSKIEAQSKNLPALNAFQTLPKKILKNTLGKVIGGDFLLDWAYKFKDAAKAQKRDELLQKALSDPQVAKLLMRPLKEKKNMEKLAEYLFPYIGRSAVFQNKSEDEKK